METLVVCLDNAWSLERIVHLQLNMPSTTRNRHLWRRGKQPLDRLVGLIETPKKSEGRCPVS